MDVIAEILESWGWTGIDPAEVIRENDFGNLIVRDVTGKYWRICPEDVYCEVVANGTEELDKLSRDQEFLADWYMAQLVEQARKHIGPLTEGRKYCFVVPGVLGGAYDVSNIKSVSFDELIRFSGDLGRQIPSLPDGAEIELKVLNQ